MTLLDRFIFNCCNIAIVCDRIENSTYQGCLTSMDDNYYDNLSCSYIRMKKSFYGMSSARQDLIRESAKEMKNKIYSVCHFLPDFIDGNDFFEHEEELKNE